eukprot:g45049.t1
MAVEASLGCLLCRCGRGGEPWLSSLPLWPWRRALAVFFAAMAVKASLGCLLCRYGREGELYLYLYQYKPWLSSLPLWPWRRAIPIPVPIQALAVFFAAMAVQARPTLTYKKAVYCVERTSTYNR